MKAYRTQANATITTEQKFQAAYEITRSLIADGMCRADAEEEAWRRGEAGGMKRTPTVDEIGFIQIADTKILIMVAKGEVDLNLVAREELANRGLGLDGKWVGFKKARKIHGVQS